MKKSKICILTIITSIALALSACGNLPASGAADAPSNSHEASIPEENVYEAAQSPSPEQTLPPEEAVPQPCVSDFSIGDVSPYSGQPYAIVNNNIPYFSESDFTIESFEVYSDLDDLGRCGVAYANIGLDIMPTEERGEIGQIKPTGWHTVKYDIVSGNYLYNRCHLIGYQLSGENANEKNLITGTCYMNVDGMLPFENMVADYVKETGNHVLYRVTPVFEGDNLLASGVLMEAESVEDSGESILFCVFAYNVYPDIIIDYATGESSLSPNAQTPEPSAELTLQPTEAPTEEASVSQEEIPQGTTYILNTNTKKFHYPSCRSVTQMNEKNKQEYTGSREDIISMGYDPCKNCNP